MRTGMKYTEKELLYLEVNWGTHSISRMANKLKRSEKAILVKARRLGLGNPLDYKHYLIPSEVCELLGVTSKTLKKHFEKRGLKYKYKKINNRKITTIEYEDLIDWMMNNTQYWDGTKVDEYGLIALGFDEVILRNKIKEDTLKTQRTNLTEKDVKKIIELYKKYYKYEDIAKILNKEYQTVKWKIHTLIESGILEQNTKSGRLVRTINRENYGWQEWQDKILIKEFRNGKTLSEIAEMVGKSLGATKSRNQVLTKRMIKGLAI